MPETCQNLSDRQTHYLAALLNSPTICAAAEKAQISERTAYRWLADDEAFRSAYLDAKRQCVAQVTLLLSTGASNAVEALLEIVADEAVSASARVAAAAKVLDLTFKSVELDDLAHRLQTLETRLTAPQAMNGHHVDV